jgi:hypothetical protein
MRNILRPSRLSRRATLLGASTLAAGLAASVSMPTIVHAQQKRRLPKPIVAGLNSKMRKLLSPEEVDARAKTRQAEQRHAMARKILRRVVAHLPVQQMYEEVLGVLMIRRLMVNASSPWASVFLI